MSLRGLCLLLSKEEMQGEEHLERCGMRRCCGVGAYVMDVVQSTVGLI